MLSPGHLHDAQGHIMADLRVLPAFVNTKRFPRSLTLREGNLRADPRVRDCVVEFEFTLLAC